MEPVLKIADRHIPMSQCTMDQLDELEHQLIEKLNLSFPGIRSQIESMIVVLNQRRYDLKYMEEMREDPEMENHLSDLGLDPIPKEEDKLKSSKAKIRQSNLIND